MPRAVSRIKVKMNMDLQTLSDVTDQHETSGVFPSLEAKQILKVAGERGGGGGGGGGVAPRHVIDSCGMNLSNAFAPRDILY